MNITTIDTCNCACHEPESIYVKEKSGHCWVCKNGMLIIKEDVSMLAKELKGGESETR